MREKREKKTHTVRRTEGEREREREKRSDERVRDKD